MSLSKKFLRRCISCGAYRMKSDLIKITAEHNTGEIFVNPDSSVFGRSCYICKDKNCTKEAFHKMKISKVLKKNVNLKIKEKIMTVLAT